MAVATFAITTGIQMGISMWGANKAKAAYKRAAKLAWAETLEQSRRLVNEQKYTEALTRARLAASGALATEGTPLVVQEDMQQEHRRQNEWLLSSGAQRAKEIRRGGQAAWYGSVIDTIGKGMSAWGDYKTKQANLGVTDGLTSSTGIA